jgi:hypothetical protein
MAGSTGALYAINPNMAQQFITETKKKKIKLIITREILN